MSQDWTKPSEPFQTGPCSCCDGTVDPHFVTLDIDIPGYKGDVVLLTYRDEAGVRKISINGRVFAWEQVREARAHADELFGVEHADHVMFAALQALEGDIHAGCTLN